MRYTKTAEAKSGNIPEPHHTEDHRLMNAGCPVQGSLLHRFMYLF